MAGGEACKRLVAFRAAAVIDEDDFVGCQ